VTTVGSNGPPSFYGTYDQSGNVWEWNDLDGGGGSFRGHRGGSWRDGAVSLTSGTPGFAYEDGRFEIDVTQVAGTDTAVGFRLASLDMDSNHSIDALWSLVDDVGNTAAASGYGSVAYNYFINKFCVTNDEYALFLNSVAITDPYNLYSTAISLESSNNVWPIGITRAAADGSYHYDVKTNYGNKPVVYVTWFSCARYCNWLHNGQGDTETGAYSLNGMAVHPSKNVGAKYHIPTENEWYKAAYYKGGSTNAGYWLYATQSNSVPVCVSANSVGDGIACQLII